MFSAVCLTLTAAILAWIVRYRVHIHVEYEPHNRKRRRRAVRRPQDAPAGNYEAETVATLTEALVSLGAGKMAARAAARQTLADLPNASSEELLRAAIQQATRSHTS